MEYSALGRTGVQVSRLCLGTMTFGAEADLGEASRMYTAARDAGINFFDCANTYARGRSEEMLGQLITCLLYTSPSPRDATLSRMPSSA